MVKKDNLLKRKRIESLMAEILSYPLTVVSAPMGYGKTTSVKSYTEEHLKDAVWLSMQGIDGDEIIFWNKLVSAFSIRYPRFSESIKKIGFPDEPVKILEIIELMKKYNDRKKKVLVLDDFHLLEKSETTLQIIDQIIRETISNIHLVIISRTKPNFNYSELMIKGLCQYIDAKSLSLNEGEVKDYFEMMNIQSTDKEMREIYSYTKGWISAIYLICLGMKEGIPMSNIVGIDELIKDNLFEPLDQLHKETVLKLSLLDEFTKEEGAAILGNPQTYEIIEELINKNAFIGLDDFSGKYSFHSIFLNFLRKMYPIENINSQEIFLRAGDYFMQTKEIPAAFSYYNKAESMKDFLNGIKKFSYNDISKINLEILYEIYTHIPEYMFKIHPKLMMNIAYEFILSGNNSLRVKGIRIKDILLYCFEESELEMSDYSREEFQGEVDLLNILLNFNDVFAMTGTPSYSRRLENNPIPELVSRKIVATLGLPNFLYQYHNQVGDLKKKVKIICDGFPLENPKNFNIGFEELALGEYYLETLEEEKAEKYTEIALSRAKNSRNIGVMICCNFNFMRLQRLKGNIKKAVDLAKEAEGFLEEHKNHMTYHSIQIYRTTLDLFYGYLYGNINKVEKIPVWCYTEGSPKGEFLLKGMGFPNIIHGKALILMKKWIELEVVCENFFLSYQEYNNIFGLMTNNIYLAIAKLHLQGEEEAAKILAPVLIHASQDQVYLTIAEHADHIFPILKFIKNEIADFDFSVEENKYFMKLINLCKRYSENISEKKDRFILTKREIEVLKSMEQGLTRKEIGVQLCISISAVKKHLENIYYKLDANNKVIAIQRAKEKKLI